MVAAFSRFTPCRSPLTLHCQNRTNLVSDYSSDDSVGSHYPGSKQLRRAVAAPVADRAAVATWDAHPIVKMVLGVQLELFTSGQLGQALNGRAAVTVRLWERNGVLPTARMRLHNKNGKGGRRYYTRAQVEGIRRIAQEEGLFEPRARLTPQFTRRVFQLFVDLEKK